MQYEDGYEGYQPLPKKLFSVRVPAICTYNRMEIELFGMPTDRDAEGNVYKECYKEMILVMLPLDRIIEIYVSGYPITIPKKEDLTAIYGILERYLRGVVNAEHYSPNFRNIQDDRLPDIERFANEMFNINKGLIVTEVIGKRNNNPFGLGVDLMEVKTVKHVIDEMNTNTNTTPSYHGTGQAEKVGIMSDYSVGYTNSPVPSYNYNNIPAYNNHDNVSYIYDNLPDIDVNKLTRHPIFKKKFE